VGTRPTVDGGAKVVLETYLFDFDKEIYGRYVEVHFKQKIRDEVRFYSLEQLKAQIKKDVAEAKKIFAEIKRL
jgi:riboflavin kinase/FMN adenylyltransferase